MKGISAFFVLFLKLFCESEIYFKLKMNTYIKEFGFLFGARNKGDGEWAEPNPANMRIPPRVSGQCGRNPAEGLVLVDLSKKWLLELSTICAYAEAG